MITNLLSLCSFCHAYPVRHLGFCTSCNSHFNLLQRFKKRGSFKMDDISVNYLMEWHSDGDFLMAAFCKTMKAAAFRQHFFEPFREPILTLFDQDPRQNYRVLWVPSSKPRSQNHSFVLAKFVAETLGATLLTCLDLKSEKTSQKRKSRQERLAAKWDFEKSSLEALKDAWRSNEGRLLIVDDILTTGSTLKSLVRDLELPPYLCDVLVPVYRFPQVTL